MKPKQTAAAVALIALAIIAIIGTAQAQARVYNFKEGSKVRLLALVPPESADTYQKPVRYWISYTIPKLSDRTVTMKYSKGKETWSVKQKAARISFTVTTWAAILGNSPEDCSLWGPSKSDDQTIFAQGKTAGGDPWAHASITLFDGSQVSEVTACSAKLPMVKSDLGPAYYCYLVQNGILGDAGAIKLAKSIRFQPYQTK